VVLWSVDPFEVSLKPSLSAIQSVARLIELSGACIRPVYVATPSMGDLKNGFDQALLEIFLDHHVAEFGLPALLPGIVLVNELLSAKLAVQKLLEFSELQRAQWVMVSSRGRSSLGNFLFGSFAENLLKKSKCPVFFLTHQPRPVADVANRPKAIFATDFTENSLEAFRKFLELAGEMTLEIALFHSLVYPFAYASAEGFVVPDNFFEEQRQWAILKASAWVDLARKAGVAAKYVNKTGGIGFVSGEEIMASALEVEASLIVLASDSNSFDRLLAGSAAFEIFRANRFPVLVYGPGTLENIQPAISLTA
jgi:nucleotide-binding universal stress UspA family protein